MTDKELLELAAKAANIDRLDFGKGEILTYSPDGYTTIWNPLKDDADALRLAVDLGMVIDARYKNGGMRAHNEITYWVGDDVTGRSIIWGLHRKDEAKSTCRRAITCAAAEIGKAIP